MQATMKQESFKQLHTVLRSGDRHWVGNGFPVQTLFVYPNLEQQLSPFLLLDYAGPAEFSPTTERRGVGGHPHRGFETVTIVYEGEVEHRDSSGGGGRIGPGDVQWMTAASGLVHEEYHGRDFAQRGGIFEVAQLWVNLPARYKMTSPRYQAIQSNQIPNVKLANEQGSVRVIAGEFENQKGPANTFTPMNVWDLRLVQGAQLMLNLPDNWSTILVVLNGALRVNGGDTIASREVGMLDREGTQIKIDATENTTALLLSGEPIDEPIFGSGPFVMNTAEEIRQALIDYHTGKMGQLS